MNILWKLSERHEDLERTLTVTLNPYTVEGKRQFGGFMQLPVSAFPELATAPLGTQFTVTLTPVPVAEPASVEEASVV